MNGAPIGNSMIFPIKLAYEILNFREVRKLKKFGSSSSESADRRLTCGRDRGNFQRETREIAFFFRRFTQLPEDSYGKLWNRISNYGSEYKSNYELSYESYEVLPEHCGIESNGSLCKSPRDSHDAVLNCGLARREKERIWNLWTRFAASKFVCL